MESFGVYIIRRGVFVARSMTWASSKASIEEPATIRFHAFYIDD